MVAEKVWQELEEQLPTVREFKPAEERYLELVPAGGRVMVMGEHPEDAWKL